MVEAAAAGVAAVAVAVDEREEDETAVQTVVYSEGSLAEAMVVGE